MIQIAKLLKSSLGVEVYRNGTLCGCPPLVGYSVPVNYSIDEIFFFEEEEEEKTALSFWTSNPLCKNSVVNTEHQDHYN